MACDHWVLIGDSQVDVNVLPDMCVTSSSRVWNTRGHTPSTIKSGYTQPSNFKVFL